MKLLEKLYENINRGQYVSSSEFLLDHEETKGLLDKDILDESLLIGTFGHIKWSLVYCFGVLYIIHMGEGQIKPLAVYDDKIYVEGWRLKPDEISPN